eukprot:scaffold7365_cov121-Skeletonema_dohrnii-CCMP3373.AAC.2
MDIAWISLLQSGLRNCSRLSNALSSDTTCSNLFPFHLFSTLIHSTVHVQISASADFCTIFDTYTCRTANDGDEKGKSRDLSLH